MSRFLIQTIGGKIKHDFSFALLEAVEYQNWFHHEEVHQIILSEKPDHPECIPVGTVEFVLLYLKKHYEVETVLPLNIPLSLQKPEYLKREVKIIHTDIHPVPDNGRTLFVKDNRKIKGFCDMLSDFSQLDGEYLISEPVDIDSEWRAFVYNGTLVGLENYLGDFTMFPDVGLIKQMIADFTDSPPAYTLDVGISNRGTFLIEGHAFFSCGLYGFCDFRVLPQMFSQTFHYLLQSNLS